MASVSAADSTPTLPNPKQIGGVPAAIHDATSSSASVGNSIVSAPTKGRLAIPFRPFGCQPGKAHLVVGLDFQRSAFGDPSRPGACGLRQTEFTALRILDLLPSRAKPASRTPSSRSGPTAPAGTAGAGRWLAAGRYAAWRTECRNTPRRWRVVLEIHAGEQQVGPVRQRRQRRAHLRPALGKRLRIFAPQPAQLLDPPGVCEETRPEVAVRVQDGLQIRSVGDRRRPGRLGEADHLGRDGHVHVMPAAHQLAADSDVGLDFAASSPVASTNFIAGS